MIQYKSEIRAKYRLGRVVDVKAGIDGFVRKVILEYKLPNEKVHRLVDRPIHGIAVIVPVEEQNLYIDSSPSNLDPNASEFHPSYDTQK